MTYILDCSGAGGEEQEGDSREGGERQAPAGPVGSHGHVEDDVGETRSVRL